MSKRQVRAAGGVLWRDLDGQVEVAVVHRPRYDDWSLPKGKLDTGELDAVAALREVQEETGFRAVLGRSLGATRYRVLDRGRDVPKTVRWWALQMLDGRFVPSEEVDQLRWLTVPRAVRTVTAGGDDGVLERFAECPPRTSTVLLVRHARAGRREDWSGPDEERPLDDLGWTQAAAHTQLLPLWAPRAVLSAPPLRCRQTVEGAAQRLDLPVELDPSLSDEAADKLPGRLRELGAAGRSVVVCSQGGAIGAAVRELTEEAGLSVADLTAPKGSLWALTWSEGRLIDADRTDPPR